MGIQLEFNPDLALRNIREHHEGRRGIDECIPENLEVGKEYNFYKEGQRAYWLQGPIPLCETQGGGRLSKPLAAVQIIRPTHDTTHDNKLYTTGKYRVLKIRDGAKPLFEALEMIE